MVVLGQVVKGVACDRLHAGMETELVLDTLTGRRPASALLRIATGTQDHS
jgi:hypothetical protein